MYRIFWVQTGSKGYHGDIKWYNGDSWGCDGDVHLISSRSLHFFSQSWEICRECCRNCSIQNHPVSIQNAEFIPRPPIFHVPNLHRLPIFAKQNLQKSHEISTGPAYVSFLSFPCCIPVSAISGVVIWTKAAWFLLRKMEPDTGGF